MPFQSKKIANALQPSCLSFSAARLQKVPSLLSGKRGRHGSKALANIRLAQVELPLFHDTNDVYRLYLAEMLFDGGMKPPILMKELGFDPKSVELFRYSPDQPRDSHGRWTNGSGAGAHVAAQEKKPDEEDFKDQAYEWRRRAGLKTPEEDVAHGHARGLCPNRSSHRQRYRKMFSLGLMAKPVTKANFSVIFPVGKMQRKSCLTL